MKLGKFIPNKERSPAKISIQKFDMGNNEWSVCKGMIFEIEDKAFVEGGFHVEYKTKIDYKSFRENRWVVRNIARL